MTSPTDARPRRSGRRILLAGGLALAVVYLAGAVVQVPRVQADLSDRVEQALADDGIVVRAEFSGQDGVLHCDQPLADPQRAVTLASEVWGVRVVEPHSSCSASVGGDSTVTTSTTAAATPTTATSTTVTATSSTVTATTVTSSSTTVTSTSEPADEQDAVFSVLSADGQFVISGSLTNDLERLAVLQRAADVVGPFNVTDELTVDPQAPGIPAAQFVGVVDLLAMMPVDLVAGELLWDGSTVTVRGTYAGDEPSAAFDDAAVAVGAVVALGPRATATRAQGEALETELNDVVAAEPILFERGSSTISVASFGTLMRVAGIAKRYAGLAIEVQGHTDSEGDPARNLTLSEQRAAAVLEALVARGVPADDLTATGFGMTELVTDADGNELPDKSRRVVFGVTPDLT